MISDKEAFDRAVVHGSVDPLLRKALRYLDARLRVVEAAIGPLLEEDAPWPSREELEEVKAQCLGTNSSTSSTSTKTKSEPSKSSPRRPARTAASRSKKDPTES